MKSADIIIIGAGPGGYETAIEAVAKGLSVIIVEKYLLGGTCLNKGCIPTKVLLKSAEVIELLQAGDDFGIEATAVNFDYSRAVERKNRIVEQLRTGVSMLLDNPLITVVTGEAKIISESRIAVFEEEYEATKAIIIATGSAPAMLPIEGSDLAMTSDDFLELTDLPESVVVIGGGVIGLEFANILNGFNVDVTVLEYCKEILPPFDRELAKRLRTILSRKGITFVTDAEVESIKSDSDGKTVSYKRKGKTQSVEAESVLMAVGRKAVLPCGLKEIDVKLNRNFIETDDKFRTSVVGVYAIGDVNGKCMLAHAATAQGKIAIADVLDEKQVIDTGVMPSAVFTNPELAMVGLTEEIANEKGFDAEVKKTFFRINGKALADGNSDGLVKIIIDKEKNKIAGCHVLGSHASDIIAEVALAMANNLTPEDILKTIHSHPTLSEIIVTALK